MKAKVSWLTGAEQDDCMYSITRALALLTIALSIATGSFAQTPRSAPAADPHRVVFVCEHGSVKSLIASLYFNQRAQQRGLPYTAVARGTAPDAVVPPTVREGLRAAGFDVGGYVPLLFQAADVDGASLVVSFDQDIVKTVAGRAKQMRWDNLPGVLADYARGRDEILKHVDVLIEELAASAHAERTHD